MASDARRRRRDGLGDSTAALPTSILALILSLLPLHTALRCAYLSKPWFAALQELLEGAADLDLGKDFAQGLPVERYSSLVKSALAVRQGCEVLNILKIFFRVGSTAQLACAQATLLTIAALKRSREVDLVLVVDKHFRRNFYYRWLSEPFVFTSMPHCWSSITRLSLIWDGKDHLAPLEFLPLDPRIDLPLLQMLSLRQVQVTNFLDSIFASCLLLSTVKLIGCSGTSGLKISSPRFSSLEILHCNTREGTFELDEPALKKIYYFKHMKCIFPENGTAWVDVYVHTIRGPQPGNIPFLKYKGAEDCWFLPGLLRVLTLTLYEGTLLHLMALCRPTVKLLFRNLRTLQLILLRKKYIYYVFYYLQKCSVPVLENLFLEFAAKTIDNGEEYELKKPIVALGLLRFVSIKGFAGGANELKVVEFFLTNVASLKTLVVRIDECLAPFSEADLVALQMKLELLPKASASIKIFVCRDADDVVGVPPPPHPEFHTRGSDWYVPRSVQSLL